MTTNVRETIPFYDEHGDLTVLVWDLKPESSVSEIRELFTQNGISPVIGIILGRTTKRPNNTVYAICILGSPSLVRRALTFRFLISTNNKNHNPEVLKRVTKFEIPLHMCESLLNLYLPFNWSSEMKVLNKMITNNDDENHTKQEHLENNCVEVCFSISFNHHVVSEGRERVVMNENEENPVEKIKIACAKAMRIAFNQLELIIFPSSSGSKSLLKLKTENTIV